MQPIAHRAETGNNERTNGRNAERVDPETGIVRRARTEQVAAVASLPNSDQRLGCHFQLNGDWLAYPTTDAPLVLSISVRGRDAEDAENLRQVKARYAGLAGTYLSGRQARSLDALQSTPAETLARDVLSAGMFSGPNVRWDHADWSERFADCLAAVCFERGATLLHLDEIIHPSSGGTSIGWDKTCAHVKRITDRLHMIGCALVVNVAGSPWIWSEADCELLANVCDGVSLEAPFFASDTNEPRFGRRTERIRRELQTYRRWLDAGQTIVLVPQYGAPQDEQRVCAALLLMIRQTGDRCFVHREFWTERPDWDTWPVELREALRPCRQKSGVWSRAFQNGSLRVTPATSQVEVRMRAAARAP